MLVTPVGAFFIEFTSEKEDSKRGRAVTLFACPFCVRVCAPKTTLCEFFGPPSNSLPLPASLSHSEIQGVQRLWHRRAGGAHSGRDAHGHWLRLLGGACFIKSLFRAKRCGQGGDDGGSL